jgi:Fur family transcriptional regulator, ferric uptake regulator
MKSVDILRKYKIKVTIGRKKILDSIIDSESALSAEQIYNQCIQDDNNINLSTIYRTLELFCEKNIIDKFDLGYGRYSYLINKDNHKHIIECSLCHKEIEVECPMKQIGELIKNKTGFTMIEHKLSMKGICDKCKQGK